MSLALSMQLKSRQRRKESVESEKRKGPMTTGWEKEEEPAEQPEEQPGSRRSRRVSVIKTTQRVFHTGNGPLSQVHIYSFNNSEHMLHSRHSAGGTMDKLFWTLSSRGKDNWINLSNKPVITKMVLWEHTSEEYCLPCGRNIWARSS